MDPGDKIRFAVVQPGERSGSNWVIEEGVTAGERVVTDGLFRIRPGATVKPGRTHVAPRTYASADFDADSLSSLSASAGGQGLAFTSAGRKNICPPSGANLITLP